MNNKIAVIVVTFNRLELLKRCIGSIRKQSRIPDEIIVINNNSMDGTTEWLSRQADLTVITQKNSGSAGGQHTGIKTAFERGFNWFWCMDDDCFAKEDALEKLLELKNPAFNVRNCLVIDIKDQTRLAFGLYDFVAKKYFLKTEDFLGEYHVGVPNFFVGSLINRDVVSKAGLPFKDFFIRGDEIEYALRIQGLGIKCATIFSSVIFHNYERNILIDNRFFSYKFLFIDSVKRYYHTRNLIIINKLHRIFTLKTFIKMFILDCFFIIFRQVKPLLVGSLLKGIYDGIKFRHRDLIGGGL
jgi:GT2 family glycosyltransferase